ncbi:hypothetical protein IMZ68_05710 [Candidatus Bathyarchaeota archaeon]|nr:hypothetical protein [Candidatus Bathyarchaeota archaeon]
MKRIFLAMTLTIMCVGLMFAQSTTFDQVFRNNGNGVNGSLWSNSLTHYTEFIDMKDVDSAQVVVNFPDSVNVAFYVENYTDASGVVNIVLNAPAGTGAADSITYVTDNTGMSHAFSLTTWYDAGYPIIRVKAIFGSTKNHATTSATYATQKYKMYIKRFRHK